ncbi:hypothetical protein RCL1_005481 [Eukaryota sp. TZLM3-RCL]
MAKPNSKNPDSTSTNNRKSKSKVTQAIAFDFKTDQRIAFRKSCKPPVVPETFPQFKPTPLNPKIFESHGDLGVPNVRRKSPTKTRSPKLQTLKRGQLYQQELQEKLAEEERQKQLELEQHTFHAQPLPPTHFNPFIPEPSNKDPTEIDDVQLATEERAKLREQFDKENEQRLLEEERQKEEEMRRKRQEDEAKLRMEARKYSFKARPIRKYKPVNLKLHSMPLTVPKAPSFLTRGKSPKNSPTCIKMSASEFGKFARG